MHASERTTRTIIRLLSGKFPSSLSLYFLIQHLFSKTQYRHENLKWKSKEINESKSTLIQDTMSRTAFPSFRFSPLSFSFPGDCRMRFSDAPSVYFCFFFFYWISLLSNFSSLVCFGFLPYACQFCFWKYTYLCTEPFRQRP
jgi:hypothetical protein